MSKKLFIGFISIIAVVMFICAHGYSETLTFPMEETDSEFIPFAEEGFFSQPDESLEARGESYYCDTECWEVNHSCGCDGNPYYTSKDSLCVDYCCNEYGCWSNTYMKNVCRHTSNCAQ